MGVLGNNIRLGASAAGDYEIEKSLRFNPNDSANLTRTSSAASSSWTYSAWIKRSQFAGYQYIFSTGSSGFSFHTSDNTFYVYSSAAMVTSTYKARDPSSWYHVVVAMNSGSATAWINNYQILGSVQGFSLDTGTNATRIGSHASGNFFFNGYQTEIHLADGQVLTPSSFAETNEDTGQWVPKKYAGSYGTDGFYLNFSDNSGTTATTLGKDSSGNGNNFTPNNFSVSGATTDSFDDTPTNNFPTLNYFQTRSATDDRMHDGALSIDWQNGHDNASTYATFGMHSGKWYFEVLDRTDSPGQGSAIIGVSPDDYLNAKKCQLNNAWPGLESGSGVGFNGADQWYINGANQGTYGGNWAENDIIGVAVDIDNGKIALSKNGQWADGSGNYDEANINAQKDLQGTAPHFIGLSDTSGSHDPKFTINFGQRAFSHTIPTGYKKLCSKNLSDPTILTPGDYFNTFLYTGNDSSNRDITGIGFQPDFLWIKNRSQADWHMLQDALRGANKVMYSNTTDTESTNNSNGHVNSFLPDGFNVDAGASGNVNENNENYVSWNWKESTTAGFDMQLYTGTGSAQTVNHGLGVVPEMIIAKNRSSSKNWRIYHKDMGGANKFIDLNNGDAVGTANSVWNNTVPTSSVFSVADDGGSNGNGNSLIAYLFASVEGYSKVGCYVGNGDAQGPFVYTGFKPMFVMMKALNGNNWATFDSKRDPENGMDQRLHPNLANSTNSGAGQTIDFLSNGFKITTSDSLENPSGHKVIYLAIAERSFKYSNAR